MSPLSVLSNFNTYTTQNDDLPVLLPRSNLTIEDQAVLVLGNSITIPTIKSSKYILHFWTLNIEKDILEKKDSCISYLVSTEFWNDKCPRNVS